MSEFRLRLYENFTHFLIWMLKISGVFSFNPIKKKKETITKNAAATNYCGNNGYQILQTVISLSYTHSNSKRKKWNT